MRLLSLFATAAFALIAVAQQSSPIAFTSVPPSVNVGQSYNITWGGGDGHSGVTITLRKGELSSIQTVSVLATNVQGNNFTWTPNKSLINGDDYTLSITQGLNEINFSGEFEVSGGVDPFSASLSSLLASATSSISSASASLSSANASITSAASSLSQASAGASSAGTGISMPRNTTFISPTLGPTGSTTLTTQPSSTTTGKAAASSTNAAGSSHQGDLTVRYSSPMALFFGILAAVAYAI